MASKLTLSVAAILLTGLAAGTYYYYQEYYLQKSTPSELSTMPAFKDTVQVSTLPSEAVVKVGSTETVTVNLPSSSAKKPNAMDLTFRYDSSVVEIVNIVPGRMWSSSNVLRKTIDNKLGIARLAAGQGFNTKETSFLDLVEIEYKVLKPGEIKFTLADTSIFAYVDEDLASQVQTSEVIITATN